MNKGKETVGSFIVTRCYSPILLQTHEKSLYNVTSLVLLPVYFPLLLVILLAGNTRLAALALYQSQKLPRTISPVCHDYTAVKGKTFQKIRRGRYVVDVSGTQKKSNRSAIFINRRINLSILAALNPCRQSESPFFGPIPCLWTLTNVLSILTSVISAFLLNSSCISLKTSFCCIRQKYL